ncbi:right-handed parallel beta-helix repeat-containing protein [Candidatus Lokiarchaeum ossiferum]|uniref:right-handed parallel beta-helix repeat-containing protein n=1 Tax=Candidatus Lokiarchaeum ossiferum TaxID=2951803 RepID=UPI00352D1E9B
MPEFQDTSFIFSKLGFNVKTKSGITWSICLIMVFSIFTTVNYLPVQARIQADELDPIGVDHDDIDSNPYITGSGTANSPYILENLTVNANDVGYCLWISGVNSYLIIRNCTFKNGGDVPSDSAAISLQACKRVTITNCTIQNSNYGIFLRNCDDIFISNNIIEDNRIGIEIDFTQQVNITQNTIASNSEYGILISDQFCTGISVYENEYDNNRLKNIKDNGENNLILDSTPSDIFSLETLYLILNVGIIIIFFAILLQYLMKYVYFNSSASDLVGEKGDALRLNWTQNGNEKIKNELKFVIASIKRSKFEKLLMILILVLSTFFILLSADLILSWTINLRGNQWETYKIIKVIILPIFFMIFILMGLDNCIKRRPTEVIPSSEVKTNIFQRVKPFLTKLDGFSIFWIILGVLYSILGALEGTEMLAGFYLFSFNRGILVSTVTPQVEYEIMKVIFGIFWCFFALVVIPSFIYVSQLKGKQRLKFWKMLIQIQKNSIAEKIKIIILLIGTILHIILLRGIIIGFYIMIFNI